MFYFNVYLLHKFICDCFIYCTFKWCIYSCGRYDGKMEWLFIRKSTLYLFRIIIYESMVVSWYSIYGYMGYTKGGGRCLKHNLSIKNTAKHPSLMMYLFK